eukprot:4384254-Prymnesium_polylepis.1
MTAFLTVAVGLFAFYTWTEFRVTDGGWGTRPGLCLSTSPNPMARLGCPNAEYFLGLFAVTFGVVMCLAANQCTGVRLLQEAASRQEGDLQSRLQDGTIRLLSTTWLLQQAGLIARCQDLQAEAFVSPAQVAADLLEEGEGVAALSCSPGAVSN